MDPYENLANAIVIRAAEDYRKVLRRCEQDPDKKAYIKEKESLERYFRSDWFGTLTGIDPELLIRKLCEEVREI